MTPGAVAQALGTEVLLATGTRIDALAAAAAVAGPTAGGTIIADVDLAQFTCIAVVGRDKSTTVVALDALPLIEAHVRTAGVIGLQDLPDHYEEVQQPPLS